MTEIVDAVVIGAGHNGLVAANILADAGWDVLVLEGESEPGGAVRTAEITAPGFRNDLCSAFYPLGFASPVISALDLESHGLRWRHAPAVVAHILPDDRCIVVHRDEDATVDGLNAIDPADADTWRAECVRWRRIRPALLEALFTPFPPVRAGARLLTGLGAADALRFARFGVLPVRRYAAERFRSDEARALLGGHTLHTDLGPESAGGALYGWLLTMLAQDVGFPVPEGGAGALIDAMVSRFRKSGGRVDCSRPVERVLVAGGRALGVRDASGKLIRARRAVLADVPAPVLFGQLVSDGHLPERFRVDLERFTWDDDIVKIDWALRNPVPWTAVGARSAGTVHLDSDVDGMTRYSADLAQGRIPESPFVLVGQMTTSDPTRSPEGTESLWAYTHVPRDLTWTEESADRHADRVTEIIEAHAPGFSTSVIARSVFAPGINSSRQSTVNNGTAGAFQQLVFRPVPGLGRADTPVDRLFLAGSSAHPGGGVHGGPGANAARAALARAGRFGGLYAAGVGLAHRTLYR